MEQSNKVSPVAFRDPNREISCLSIGRTTGTLMVTCSRKGYLHLWDVQDPKCINRISSMTSGAIISLDDVPSEEDVTTVARRKLPIKQAITCSGFAFNQVRISRDETIAAAGSPKGIIELWDFQMRHCYAGLKGKKTGIMSLDFHPYDSYLASGSTDGSVMVWDTRSRRCLKTYTEHAGCVNCLRFTHNGQWIASGSLDGTIKIWDMKAGRVIEELKLHTGPVTTVDINPNDHFLASGSSDGTVKVWDLKDFSCIISSDSENHTVRKVLFHPEKTCLFSASQDSLKVFGLDPFYCCDMTPDSWTSVDDLAIQSSQLIAASISGGEVSTIFVELNTEDPVTPVDKVAEPPGLSSIKEETIAKTSESFPRELLCLSSIRPAMTNIHSRFIVLEIGEMKETRAGPSVWSCTVADDTGAMTLIISDDSGRFLRPGEVCEISKGVAVLRNGYVCLVSGLLSRLGDYYLSFKESPNFSEPNHEKDE